MVTNTHIKARTGATNKHTHIFIIDTFSPDEPGKDVCDPNLEKAKLAKSKKG